MLAAILTLGGIGFITSFGLGLAAKKFAVYVDPKVKLLEEALPGANCGACGFAGCHNFAEAVASGKASLVGCLTGGDKTAQAVVAIMGGNAEQKEKVVARLRCQGDKSKAARKYNYVGVSDCKAAVLLAGGDKACAYGCLGLGSCIKVCPVNAISYTADGLIKIDEKVCVGCAKCVAECPKQVIKMTPEHQQVNVLCNSLDKGPVVKKICSVGCIGCGICVKACPVEGAICVENFLAKIDPQKCNQCKVCVAKCPTHAIIS